MQTFTVYHVVRVIGLAWRGRSYFGVPHQGFEDLHRPFGQLSAIWPAFCVLWWLSEGLKVSKQRLSHWIVDAIKASYTSQGLECPLHIRAHSSRAIIKRSRGMSIQDICLAAGWSSQNTFTRFYKWDIQSLASPVLSVSDWFMFCYLYSRVLLLAQ